MNTEKTANIIRNGNATTDLLKRECFSFEKEFDVAIDQVFPLLCPLALRESLPSWNCVILHSSSGYSEYQSIFSTTWFGTDEVWVCTRYEPHNTIEYTKFSNNFTTSVNINLKNNTNGYIVGIWTVTLSATNSVGNDEISELNFAYKVILDNYLHEMEKYIDKHSIRTSRQS